MMMLSVCVSIIYTCFLLVVVEICFKSDYTAVNIVYSNERLVVGFILCENTE